MRMKRPLALLVAATVALALFSGPATAQKKKKKKPKATQEFSASIIAPAPYAVDGSCFFRLERVQAGAGAPGGIVGAHFDIDPKTAGQKFELHIVDGSADVDLDIAFYDGYGDPMDPTNPPANVPFEERGPGGEKGIVPAGFSKAIVCMAAGQDAEFHYIAGGSYKP